MNKYFVFVLTALLFSACNQQTKAIKTSGKVFGTTYSVIYYSPKNYQKQFDSLFGVINNALSTYIPNTIISKVNENKETPVNAHFEAVFKTSETVYKSTSGIFDPTIGAVVNAWSFGPKGEIKVLDSLKIDSLMTTVGFNKVKLQNNKVVKQNPKTQLDFNAIAKGYAVDIIAEFLEDKKCQNFLVEIGGELRVKGQNVEKQKSWRVGIDKPNFNGSQSVFKAITLKNKAMATSGTYRKFKVDSAGNRYAHIINAKTGYPSKSAILSVSVIADKCIVADGYATAFQAMGVEKVKSFLKNHSEIQVFIIFENANKKLETVSLNNFPE